MSLVLYLSSPPPFLLLAILSSLIGGINGIPLSTGHAVIHAVQPTCTTLPDGSTGCNVGINPVPSLVSLDGGYQWLTVQPTTMIQSGSTFKTNEAVWTAVQTSYLDVTPVTTTAANGATTVLTSTNYVSFITTTTTPSGAAPTTLIAAAVIPPALLAPLQPIVDAAAGKTVEEIGSEIVSSLAKSGVFLALADAKQLAAVILTVGLVTVAADSARLYQPFPLKPYISNINIAPNPPPNPAATPTPSSTNSNAIETVTAIVKPPYSDYLDYQVVMIASGPTPTTYDFAISTSSTLPQATAQCRPSNVGASVEVVGALAQKFCTGLDTSKSSSSTLPGSASGLQGADGISMFFNFSSQAVDNCALGCTSSYTQMVKSCEFNSHDIFGAASLQDSCGTFAMAISSSAPPSPPPPPPPPAPVLQAQECYGKDDFGSHPDIIGAAVTADAKDFCRILDTTFTSATAAVSANGKSIIFNNYIAPYHYTVSWIDGCVTTATQQRMSQPLGPGTPTVNCVNLMTENWKNCNNGGAGGTRVVGCLRYNFAATFNRTQGY